MGACYGEDLAYIHDAGFGGFTKRAAPGLLAILRRGGVESGLVLDLGCGSGLWARELVSAGYRVLGIDVSPFMVRLARRRVPQARFRAESFLRARLPRCDAVTSIGECFSYLLGGDGSARGLSPLFRRVHEALRPGGLLIFDVAEALGSGEPAPRRRFWEGRDWAVLVETVEDRRRRLLTRRLTTFRKVGGSYRRGEEIHKLRLLRRRQIREDLARTGFSARLLRLRAVPARGLRRRLPGSEGARRPAAAGFPMSAAPAYDRASPWDDLSHLHGGEEDT